MLAGLLLQALAFTGIVTASKPWGRPHHGWKQCELLSQDDANLLITRWTTTLTKTNSDLGNNSQTWDYLLADEFKLVSGSIQTLQQMNVNGNYDIYVGKQVYIANELKYGALYGGVHDLDIIVGCNRVVWYWQVDSVLEAKIKVRGVNIFSLNDAGKITQLVVENDSLAFAVNFGANVTFPAFG
ncbi:hypothetical protein B0A48_17052 [Cryoendolithus antarcticus]|uniref:NTF2-like domain-containing protein n=1 Tax=Cryoendolithus antarcticus TaxID=1507870 RepID=A0A1V8SBV4_9PEZI|nr:hypothetical protein B0A48_17052 [Cryoendolithus antarcticus]